MQTGVHLPILTKPLVAGNLYLNFLFSRTAYTHVVVDELLLKERCQCVAASVLVLHQAVST